MTAIKNQTIAIECKPLTVSQCVSKVSKLLSSVRKSTQKYYNSTPILTVPDIFERDNPADSISWSIPIDLKIIAVIAAIAQAPLSFRGSTDKGKTALAEMILSGLFGTQDEGWWRMEINRGLTVDDLTNVCVEVESGSKGSSGSGAGCGTGSRYTPTIEAAEWLSKPARLLDEINRVHPKLANIVLHLADGTGFNVRGDISIPVGMPYRNGTVKLYSFTISTANHQDIEYAGVFEEDAASKRRAVITVDLDEVPPSSYDINQLLKYRRAKTTPVFSDYCVKDIIEIYESLLDIPSSALGMLFLHFLSGMNICIQSRSGRFQQRVNLCGDCHLAKSSRACCGKIGGLSEGLLTWVKEISAAIALVRAAEILDIVHRKCVCAGDNKVWTNKLQAILETKAKGDILYKEFRRTYLKQLCVTGEDIKAAYIFVAPNHVWIDREWLDKQTQLECNPQYIFMEVANQAWRSMNQFVKSNHSLLASIVENNQISPADQEELEAYITTQNAAVLNVVSALRNEEFPLHYRDCFHKNSATGFK